MSMKKDSGQGDRFRYIRTRVLRLTQDQLSEKLGVTRSLIPMMEKGSQGVSQRTAQMMFDQFGVDMVWLLTGKGEAFAGGKRGNPEVVGTAEKAEMSYSMSIPKSGLFSDPAYFRDRKPPGRFGYVPLVGIKVRLHAARDKDIQGTNLFRMAEDDKAWVIAGEPNGWEFEVLREYFEHSKDRSAREWLECLRFVRWMHESLMIDCASQGAKQKRTA